MKNTTEHTRTELIEGLFPDAPSAFVDRLSQPGRQKLYAAEELIFAQGAAVDGIHLIIDGVARLQIERGVGVDWARSGDWLGLVDLIGNRPHKHNARVHSPELDSCYLEKESFFDLVAGFPQIGLPILQRLTSDIHRVEDRLTDWKGAGVSDRLESMFISLRKRFGLDSEGFIRIHLNPGQMADWIGANRTTVYRRLKSLEELGRIEFQQSRVRLLQSPEPKGEYG